MRPLLTKILTSSIIIKNMQFAQVLLTTAPDATGATHWGQQMFFLDPSVSCAASDTLSVRTPPGSPPPDCMLPTTACGLGVPQPACSKGAWEPRTSPGTVACAVNMSRGRPCFEAM